MEKSICKGIPGRIRVLLRGKGKKNFMSKGKQSATNDHHSDREKRVFDEERESYQKTTMTLSARRMPKCHE